MNKNWNEDYIETTTWIRGQKDPKISYDINEVPHREVLNNFCGYKDEINIKLTDFQQECYKFFEMDNK